MPLRFVSSLRHLYWKVKYRPGRMVTFWCGFDDARQILVVENRLASSGTLVYRARSLDVMSMGPVVQDEFGPPQEATVPEMIRRLRGD